MTREENRDQYVHLRHRQSPPPPISILLLILTFVLFKLHFISICHTYFSLFPWNNVFCLLKVCFVFLKKGQKKACSDLFSWKRLKENVFLFVFFKKGWKYWKKLKSASSLKTTCSVLFSWKKTAMRLQYFKYHYWFLFLLLPFVYLINWTTSLYISSTIILFVFIIDFISQNHLNLFNI